MNKSTIPEMLKSFSPEDFKKFDDFLRSPFFNKSSTLIRLYSILKNYYPGFEDDQVEKQKIWGELFETKEYNYGVMKNLIHDLKKLILKFMTIEEFEQSNMERQTTEVRALLKRNLPKSFTLKINEIERKYSSRSFSGETFDMGDFYFYMFKIYWMKHAFYRVYDPKKAKESDMHIYTAMNVYSFLIFIIMFQSNIEAEKSNTNIDPDKDILYNFFQDIKGDTINKVMQYAEKYSEKDFNLLNLFFLRSKAIMDNATPQDFFEYRKTLFKNIDRLGIYDIQGFLYGITVSVNKMNSPLINIHKIKNECLLIQIRKKLFLEPNGTVRAPVFQNAVLNAGEINDLDTIELLRKKFLSKVADDRITDSENFIKIYLYINEGKFNEALELISKTELSSFILRVHLRLLKVRCFYELNDQISFGYDRDSLNHFLKSNTSLSKQKISLFKERFDKINALFHLKKHFSQKEFKTLKNEIMNDENYSAWMKDKIVELEKAASLKVI
ncbi:MAG: hypothetical protein KDD00_14060 [Ignavibacteriae bacterium]|nr:hypothetical protein [Ignavibacteriota bacterium]